MKVKKSWTSGRTVFSFSREKKKKLWSSLNLLDKIQDFLHTFVFKIQFSLSVVYDGYGGMFVNIRYSTEIMTTVIVIMMSMEHLIIEKHSSAYHTIYSLEHIDYYNN